MKIKICVENATKGQKDFFKEFMVDELQEVVRENMPFLAFIGAVELKVVKEEIESEVNFYEV